MTPLEVRAVVAALMPPVVEHVERTVAPLLARIAELEAREPQIGPPGPQGEPGPAGADGKDVDLDLLGHMISERIPVVRDGEPGPPGERGPQGDAGRPGIDGKDVDEQSVRSMIVDAVVELMPVPKDGERGEQGEQGPPGEVDLAVVRSMVIEEVAEWRSTMPVPERGEPGPQGERGERGADGENWDPVVCLRAVEAAVTQAVAAIPPAKDGEQGPPGADGKSVERDEVIEMVGDCVRTALPEAMALIKPEPGPPGPPGEPGPQGEPGRDGKDADELALRELILAKFDQMPIPKDGEPGPKGDKGDPGEPGRDGKDIDPEFITELTAEAMASVHTFVIEEVAKIPVPKDGEPGPKGDKGDQGERGEQGLPGKDADPLTLKGMIEDHLAAAVLELREAIPALIPEPIPGPQGEPGVAGKDADVELVRAIVREAVAALPPPLPGRDGRDGPPGKDGKDGTDGMHGMHATDIDVHTPDEGRTWVFSMTREGEVVWQKMIKTATVLDRGVWKDGGEYEPGDGVSLGGEFWIAKRCTKTRPVYGPNGDWRLAVKKGRDGKDGTPGKPGERGPEGKPGRDLTQLGPRGEKY